jgi:hypothetical protein
VRLDREPQAGVLCDRQQLTQAGDRELERALVAQVVPDDAGEQGDAAGAAPRGFPAGAPDEGAEATEVGRARRAVRRVDGAVTEPVAEGREEVRGAQAGRVGGAPDPVGRAVGVRLDLRGLYVGGALVGADDELRDLEQGDQP